MILDLRKAKEAVNTSEPVGDGPTALSTLQYGFLIKFHLLPIPSMPSPLLITTSTINLKKSFPAPISQIDYMRSTGNGG